MKDYELAMLLDEDLQEDYGHDHGSANMLKTGGFVLAGILLGIGGALAFNKVRGSAMKSALPKLAVVGGNPLNLQQQGYNPRTIGFKF